MRGILAAGGPLTSEQFESLLQYIAHRRILLAEGQLRCAVALAKFSREGERPEERLSAISRAYYAMYNAARALVFLRMGQDVSDHSKLPKHLPDDLHNRESWREKLEKYRRYRNEADYDPFARWSLTQVWTGIQEDAGLFLAVVRKACPHDVAEESE